MRLKVALLALFILALAAFWAVRGLRALPRLPAVPEEWIERAEIPGIPNARYWVGQDIGPFVRDVLEAREREAEDLGVAVDDLPATSMLAVSGGGDKGAFGAGLLCGWSESGTRPEFKAVTGVSTGALIAPFAFVGPDYDHVLRTVYTSLGPTDVARKRNMFAAITHDAMADNTPLWEQISKYIDEPLMRAIAAEHARGRVLLVGTTNLDARQPIIWNLGNIASSGAPGALDLMRKILLASAAIPGAFPPTMIRVEVNGGAYEEMHVDGGASAQVFLYPPRTRSVADELGTDMDRASTLYVIRNSRTRPSWDPVQRRTINIASPAISSMIYTQGMGDLNRIFLTAQSDGLDFNLACIEEDFTTPHTQDFDTHFMQSLFDYAFRQSKAGYVWRKSPPLLGERAPR